MTRVTRISPSQCLTLELQFQQVSFPSDVHDRAEKFSDFSISLYKALGF